MGADGVYALCPDNKCNLLVPPDVWKKCLAEEEYARYEQFLLKSFVDLSFNAKSCPGAGCQYVVANKTDKEVDVECLCGFKFCFSCLEPPHPPISCDLLEKWQARMKNNKGDIEAEMNAKWLTANAKKCPKCKALI